MGFSRRHITSEEYQFKTLLDTYNTQLFSRITSKIKDRENAKDVLQDVLVHLWNYRSEMKSDRWESIMFNTCHQKINEFLRKNRNQILNDELADRIDTSIDDLILAEKKEKLLTVLETRIALITPPIRQTIFKMNKLYGFSQKEIALQFNLSRRVVENHVAQALKFLRGKS
ncbi:sigma-70 family RNA polymerase sigma factor [Pedobacter sp. KLB.chiD]|uniref:sigma-70 family RNA polymerase sigma factor n=1 Tax=Pedobacter sp. KLB.chiD TaxID=3387402 RepID=UPI00399C0670